MHNHESFHNQVQLSGCVLTNFLIDGEADVGVEVPEVPDLFLHVIVQTSSLLDVRKDQGAGHHHQHGQVDDGAPN